MDVFRKDITSLKSFRETVAKKLHELEKTLIISQQTKPSSSLGNVGTGVENWLIRFCLDKNSNIFQTTRFNHTMIFFN